MKTINKSRYFVSHVTSKGQTTIPKSVRNILGLKDGSEIAFKPASGGFMMVRVTTTIKEENPYTAAEWKAIERLSAEKGTSFKNAKTALKHLHDQAIKSGKYTMSAAEIAQEISAVRRKIAKKN